MFDVVVALDTDGAHADACFCMPKLEELLSSSGFWALIDSRYWGRPMEDVPHLAPQAQQYHALNSVLILFKGVVVEPTHIPGIVHPKLIRRKRLHICGSVGDEAGIEIPSS